MDRRIWAFTLWLALGTSVPTVSAAGFLPRGPVLLDSLPASPGTELGFAARGELLQGRWPGELLQRVARQLEAGGGVLLVGRTDNLGPRSLNRSLGLQYAAETARGLAAALKTSEDRFTCASVGEDQAGGAGVTAFPWKMPAGGPEGPVRAAILEPGGSPYPTTRFWALWDPTADSVLWALDGAGEARLWELDSSAGRASLPYPAPATATAVGGRFSGRISRVARSEAVKPAEDPRLVLRTEERRSWAVRLSGRIPPSSSALVLWACGIPYPVSGAPGGRFEAEVALLPQACSAFLQLTDAEGRARAGPTLPLPPGEGQPPDLLAVLLWEGNGADLDLHAWAGRRHTEPQNPEPALSAAAVPHAQLLFDGDGTHAASALAAWAGDALELEAHCYSDLGGEGTDAWFYILRYPGDPLRETGQIYGPRHLSGHPLGWRWPVLTWKGD